MGRLLRSIEDQNHRATTAAANEYLTKLYGQLINPDAPMRYDPPQRDVSRKIPFKKYFHY